MTVKGKAKSKWTEGSGKNKTTYIGRDLILNSITYLLGSEHCEPQEIATGTHTYGFECQLPIPIPYSVQGEYGRVRYSVNVNLDIPWAPDLQSDVDFTVVRYEDLNYFPALKAPLECQIAKQFCCLCCASNPLILQAIIPKQGFIAGDKIPVKILLNNRSSRDVHCTTIALKRLDQYNCDGSRNKVKEVRTKIAEIRCHGVKAKSQSNFEEFIEIPQGLLLTNALYCRVFKIMYEIKVTAETGGCAKSPFVRIPFTIGTVGLKDEAETSQQPIAPRAEKYI